MVHLQVVAGQRPPSPLLSDLKSCRSMTHLKQLHATSVKIGRISDTLIAAEILRYASLSSDGDLSYARHMFDEMPDPNVFAWNTIIRAFSDSKDHPLEGISLFANMLRDGRVAPSKYTYPSVLKTCAEVRGIHEGKQLHCHVIKSGVHADGFVVSNLVRVYALCGFMEDALRVFQTCHLPPTSDSSVVAQNVILDGYVRLGKVGAAREVFDEMTKRTAVSWNGMITGYAENGLFREAVELFWKMHEEGVEPNYVTLVSVLPATSRLGDLDTGKWVHAYAEKNGIKVDDVLGSALVDMYSKCGDIDKALEVFHELPRSSTITWSAMIGGLALHGRANDAFGHLTMMEEAGVIPSDVVFIGILNACSHAGLVERGRAYFDKMVNFYGIKPRIEHYGCMVDMLGRAGLVAEAEDLMLDMPIEADDVILKALLAACKRHGNAEIGTRVAKLLMDLAPRDGGCYVLLSNLYASLGDWDNVAKVRLLMKERDIRKNPGCSWITIGGRVHEFTVEDESHPGTGKIYSMLEEMTWKLNSMGYYAPDTSQVLLNIDEEEKQTLLTYHSEKIAVAFGSATILVVELNERLTSLGIAVNLVTYLTGTMHLGNAISANAVTNFLGTSFMLCLLGGFIADTFLGRYLTIAIFAAVQAIGVTILTISTAVEGLRPPRCSPKEGPCVPATDMQLSVLYLALYLTALGTGGLKSSVSGFGSDQFDETDESDRKQMVKFFNWFFFFISLGSLLAVTVLVYIQDNVGRQWGYGICAASIVAGLSVFLSATAKYRFKKLVGSPITQIAAVLVAAWRKRKIPVPENPALLYDVGDFGVSNVKQRLPHTDQFRFLDHAAVEDEDEERHKWRLCTMTDVEEVKQLVRMLPTWATTVIFWTIYAQMTTFSVSQAATMDRRITASFEIPPGSLSVFLVGSILLVVPVYDRAIAPLAHRFTGNPHGLTPLQRIGVGLALSILAMAVAALAEIKRLDVASRNPMTLAGTAPVPLTVFWLVPQFFLVGAGEAFTYIGQLDFFLRECPKGMKTMSTGLFLSTLSLGFFLSSALVAAVHKLTGEGSHGAWLSDNLNRGKLYDFYWLLAVLSIVNLGMYIISARWYVYKDSRTGEEESKDVEACQH